MKKVLFLLSVFALSTSAFAMPTVGDIAIFAATSTQADQTVSGTVEFQLMSQDTSTNTWSEQVTTSVGGQTSVQTQSVPTTQLATDDQIQAILTNCVAAGGALQTITVPAGTFNTCAIPVSDATAGTGTAWLGAVTFGIVQQDITTPAGQHTVLELQSQTSGQ